MPGRAVRLPVTTAAGLAVAHLGPPPEAAPIALVVLGHGAGGGVDARDLAALATDLPSRGMAIALVEQPYRVAGRRAPVPAAALDEAFAAVVGELRRQPGLAGVPLVTGGRSSGSRVACRTATATGALGVVCLAFPLRPPRRPERSRAGELLALDVPVLVVQGSRDVFGDGDEVRAVLTGRRDAAVQELAGADHAFTVRRKDGRTAAEVLVELTAAVADWVRVLTG